MLSKLYISYYRNGLRDEMSARMRRGLIYNNQTLLITLLLIIAGALFLYGLAGINPMFWMLLVLALVKVFIYPINVSGYVNVATLLNSAVGAAAIFLASGALGYESHAHYFFLSLFMSYFLNAYSGLRIIFIQVGMTLLLFIVLVINDFQLFDLEIIPPELMGIQQTFVFLNSTFVIVLLAYMYRLLYVKNLQLLTKYSDNTKELLQVTNQQMTELDNNRKLLEAIYDNIDYAILLEDLNSNLIVDCNLRSLQIFDCDKSDIIGKSDFQFFRDLSTEGTSDMIRELSENDVWVGQELLRTGSGKELWGNVKLAHFTMGLRKYRLWTISDISDLMDSQHTLEEKNKELNILNEELDSFVYSVAHDMRAPLTTLHSLVRLSKVNQDPEKLAEYYKMEEQLIQRMESYISDVVNHSKNQRTEVARELIDFDALLQEVGSSFNLINSEKFNYQVEVEPELNFRSDVFRLKVIINNLIANSVRYSEPITRNALIKVSVSREADQLLIRLEDNGKGIAKEHHQEIFKMFYRADTDSNGSGLGLYIVQESLNKIGGSIDFESTVGEGTIFFIRLPFEHPAEEV